VESGRSVSYTYDASSRLKTAQTTGSTNYPAWGLSWDYDRFGNRKNQNVTLGTGPSAQLDISDTTNRIYTTGFSYDAAGNLTNDNLNTYTYDAENRLTRVGTDLSHTDFTFDGVGLRVKKYGPAGDAPPCQGCPPIPSRVYIFLGTKVVAEYLNGTLNTEYIYAGSQLLATLDSSGTPTFAHPDHLSARVFTDTTGTSVGSRAHYPFGEVWYETGSVDKWKFTSYERDGETGLDYAMFRFDSTRLGRFQTPDPLAGYLIDPQTHNRYAYVRNDPINTIDPLGLTFVITPPPTTWASTLPPWWNPFLPMYTMKVTVEKSYLPTGSDPSDALWAAGGGSGGGKKIEPFIDGTEDTSRGGGGQPKRRPNQAGYLQPACEQGGMNPQTCYDDCVKQAWENYQADIGDVLRTGTIGTWTVEGIGLGVTILGGVLVNPPVFVTGVGIMIIGGSKEHEAGSKNELAVATREQKLDECDRKYPNAPRKDRGQRGKDP